MKKVKMQFPQMGPFILTAIPGGPKSWPKTAATIGAPKIEQTEDGIYLMEAHLDSIEAAIIAGETAVADNATKQGTIDALTAQLSAAKNEAAVAKAAQTKTEGELATAKTQLTTKDGEIATLNAKLLNRATVDTPGTSGAEAAKADGKYSYTKNKMNKKGK